MKIKYLAVLTLLTFSLLESCAPDKKEWTVSVVESPAPQGASLPHLFSGLDGKLYLSWIVKGDSGMNLFQYAFMQDNKWSTPETIASGKDWFVNWADYPMLAVDEQGNMLAHYLAKSAAGTYSYDVNLMIKAKGGHWQGPIVPHTDGTPTEHGFVTLLPKNDGSFGVVWLDGRNTGGDAHEGHEGHGGGAMTVRYASISLNGAVTDEQEIDARVCDCCQTTATISASGMLIAYRDRSDAEIRDMTITNITNPEAPIFQTNDQWEIKGCPVNGPRMTTLGNTSAMAWFTAAYGDTKVKTAISTDGGISFDKTYDVTSATSGRVDIALLTDQDVFVSYLYTTDSSTSIRVTPIALSQGILPSVVVAETSGTRGSGFPQLEVYNESLYLAWTSIENEVIAIRMAKLDGNK